jgi:hypothetical protein
MFLNKRIQLLFLSLSIATVLSAQDVHFANVQRMGQWYNASLKQHRGHDVVLNFRDISYQNGVAFRTGAGMMNFTLLRKKDREMEGHRSFGNITAGAIFDQSNGDFYKNNIGFLGISYAVKINERGMYMSAGFQGMVTNMKFGGNGTFQDQFDQYGPIAGSASADPLRAGKTFAFASINAGWSIFQQTTKLDWYAGLSMRHVNRPYTEESRSDLYRMPPVYGVQGGVKLKSEFNTVDLYAMMNSKANAEEWISGVRYNFILGDNSLEGSDNRGRQDVILGVGCMYRINDAIIPDVQLSVGKTNLSFYYDSNISGIRSAGFSRRGFELLLTQKF